MNKMNKSTKNSLDYSREEFRQDLDDTWMGMRVFWKILGLIILVTALGFGVRWLFLPAALVDKVANPDAIISNYENFQEMYNTCQKLDSDLKTICETSSADAMFSQFSKGAMVAAKRQQMTRWINEYNAKSKMITRQYWKSGSLPYQLNEETFPNYTCTIK